MCRLGGQQKYDNRGRNKKENRMRKREMSVCGRGPEMWRPHVIYLPHIYRAGQTVEYIDLCGHSRVSRTGWKCGVTRQVGKRFGSYGSQASMRSITKQDYTTPNDTYRASLAPRVMGFAKAQPMKIMKYIRHRKFEFAHRPMGTDRK
ncbi:hypothetical protein J6590_011712 [Homalodisca vitripennis]|nr:hypothetical protein J6590_011712 [Homalodisca vitripennis]